VVIAIEECSSIADKDAGTTVADRPSRHEAHRTEERFMKSVVGGFSRTRPDNFSRTGYGMVEFDCMSVGRSPVVNGVLYVMCKAKDGTQDKKDITVGSIPSDEFVHLRLWIDHDLSDVEYRWLPDLVKHKNGDDVDFHARNVTFATPTIITATEGPSQKPSVSPTVVL
jgi:hypothetical protein